MRNSNYDGLSDKDIIRRQRDKINGYKHQIEMQIMSNKEISKMNSDLLGFMARNNLFSLFHKQKDELNGRA